MFTSNDNNGRLFIFKEDATIELIQFLLFLNRERGSLLPIESNVLLSLIYLIDRESIKINSFPITRDRAIFLKNGPVLINTLYLINSSRGVAKRWPSEKEFELKNLSRADAQVIKSVFKKYIKKSEQELNKILLNLPECKNKDLIIGSIISDVSRMEALKKPRKWIEELISCWPEEVLMHKIFDLEK